MKRAYCFKSDAAAVVNLKLKLEKACLIPFLLTIYQEVGSRVLM